jgi:TolB-like protein/DNA-binding winged helix-turn-helix (wHTH) protein/Tfp pilus assembly protein PilF
VQFTFGTSSLDVERRELRRAAELVPVQPQVFDLIVFLVKNRDRVVSKDELIDAVWGGRVISDSTLTSRLNAARAAIGDSGEEQKLIRTYARRGVRFVGTVEEPGGQPVASAETASASAAAPAEQERPAVVLVAEPLGFAALLEWDKERSVRTLGIYRDVIVNFIGAHRGRVFANDDQRIAAEFPSAADAVRAAADFQQELGARNAPLSPGARLQFAVGIAAGVDAAAKVQAAADAGGICVAANVHDAVAGQTDLRFIPLGHIPGGDASLQAFRATPLTARTAAQSRGKPTVAVLPFTNMSGDPEQEYLSDGITDDIITALSRHRSLFVVARNSTFVFKGRGTDVRRVGADLGADYVVEGGIRKIGERIRISAQLIETEGGRHLWAERYDRDLDQIFAVQDEIIATIAAQIEPEVGTAERQRVERKGPQAFDAWDFFHLGQKHLYKSTLADNAEAQRLLRRAIELDPGLAQAHAFLSYAIVLSMIYFESEPDEKRLDEAVAIARTAAELDDKDGLIRFIYGRGLLAQRAYADALAELEAAIDLNPSLAVSYCGLADSLAYEGRYREAIPVFEKAIKLSPYDPQRWAFYSYRALAHLFAREFEQALEWAQKATRVPNCHYWPFAHRVAALGFLPQREGLEVARAELLQRKPAFSCSFARQRLFYIKDPEQLDLYAEGLRKAGIPP